jgi:hypothetical protein
MASPRPAVLIMLDIYNDWQCKVYSNYSHVKLKAIIEQRMNIIIRITIAILYYYHAHEMFGIYLACSI